MKAEGQCKNVRGEILGDDGNGFVFLVYMLNYTNWVMQICIIGLFLLSLLARREYNYEQCRFWTSVHGIIAEGFTSEGLQKLDSYAEQFISGKLVYQRFSPQEQHGCAAGGTTNVIASLLAGAEIGSDSDNPRALSDY